MVSGFEEVREYKDTVPAPRWSFGPREATGTLVNSICITLGSTAAFALEEIAKNQESPVFSSIEGHTIATTATLTLGFRVLAYFLRNGGSSAIGDTITSVWNRLSKKGNKND
jgi:hypothetical protein